MTDFYQRPAIGEIRIKDGVEHLFEECGRCGGTGTYPSLVDGGRCFECRATYKGMPVSTGGHWVTKADFERRAKRRAADAKRREAKAAALAAELPAKITALIETKPILAELLKLEDYSGFLGSLRSQLEKKGQLSDAQIAAAARILMESAERQAHAENERRGRTDGPIGEIGDRREFTGKVVWFDHVVDNFKPYEAYNTVMIIVTDEGSIKWRASKYLALETGQQITVKATVKSHDADRQQRIITIVTKGTVLD